jgi:hypothetical protein
VTSGPAAAYFRQMTGKHALGILPLAILVAAATGCGSVRSSSLHALDFPPSTPAWIEAAATQTAASLDDPDAAVVSVSLGPHPVVVLAGTFTCGMCSRPAHSTAVPTGAYAALRYDAATRQGTDFGLAGSEQEAVGGLDPNR